jgi:hypothetical protein
MLCYPPESRFSARRGSRPGLDPIKLVGANLSGHQISLSAPILVTTVVCLAIFVTAVYLSPETKGKELVAELQVA